MSKPAGHGSSAYLAMFWLRAVFARQRGSTANFHFKRHHIIKGTIPRLGKFSCTLHLSRIYLRKHRRYRASLDID